MWEWSLDWGEVTPGLVVGSCPMVPGDLDTIQRRAGVTAVLSVQHDDCLAYWRIDYEDMKARGARLGLCMARAPMRDFDLEDQRRGLPAAVTALAGLRAAEHRVYVHCTAGLGRSPLTVLAYLSWIECRSPQEAIALIHRVRPGAVPSWEAYHGCRTDLVARNRHRIERQAYARYLARAKDTGDAQDDWAQAEAEVLCTALSGDGG